jgi:rod shape-determining protein MreD
MKRCTHGVRLLSLWYGVYAGSIYGLLIGVITDILFGNTFGIFTLSYTLVGGVIGYLNYNYRKESKVSLSYLTIFGTCIFEFMQYLIYLFLSSSGTSIFYLKLQMVISSLLNVILEFILYGAFAKISEYADENIIDY